MAGDWLVRKAGHIDMPGLIEVSRDLWRHTEYTEPFEAEQASNMLQLSLDQGLTSVLEVNGEIVGAIAGICSFISGSTQAKCATELILWVKESHRDGQSSIALLEFMEQLAARNGIKYWHVVALESYRPRSVGKAYERRGYSKTETTYTKILQ